VLLIGAFLSQLAVVFAFICSTNCYVYCKCQYSVNKTNINTLLSTGARELEAPKYNCEAPITVRGRRSGQEAFAP